MASDIVGYYPGCSLHGTSREYDESLRAVAGALGVPLAELDDWSCCGATQRSCFGSPAQRGAAGA